MDFWFVTSHKPTTSATDGAPPLEESKMRDHLEIARENLIAARVIAERRLGSIKDDAETAEGYAKWAEDLVSAKDNVFELNRAINVVEELLEKC